MKALVNGVALSIVGLLAWASFAEVLEYGTPENPHPGGMVSVDEETPADGMRFALGETPLTFSGEGSFALAADAKLTNHYGCVRFEVPLAGAGDVTFAGDAVLTRSDSSIVCLKTEDQLLFPNTSLDRLIPVGGMNCGSIFEYAKAYNVTRADGVMTVQYQHKYDYVKCVIAEFRQVGADVYGRVTDAYYFNSPTTVNGVKYYEGCDIVEMAGLYPKLFCSNGRAASSLKSGGYGLEYVDMLVAPEVCDYALADAFSAEGRIRLAGGACVAFDGDAAVCSRKIEMGEVTQLVVSNTTDFALTGGFSGSGCTLTFGPGAPSEIGTCSLANAIRSATEVIVVQDASIADLQGVSDPVGNYGTGTAVYWYEHNGSNVTFQVQGTSDGWNKCSMVELYDKNGNIYGRATKRPYASVSAHPLGSDFRTFTPTGGGSYELTGLTLTVPTRTKGAIGGTSALTNATIVVANGLSLDLTDQSVMPLGYTSILEVQSNATVNLTVQGTGNSYGYGDGRARKIVRKGGVLKASAGSVFGSSMSTSPIVLDGGTLAFECGSGSASDANTYIQFVDFWNGAQMNGYRPRFGGGVKLTARGTSPSFWTSGALTVANATSDPVVFAVDDVTGDDRTDFIASGVVADFGSTYVGMPFKKTGAGTMQIDAAWTLAGSRFTVAEGTLRLGVSTALKNATTLTLSGGTLALAAGKTQTLAALTVTTNSALAVESGAKLSFADSSAVAWTADRTRIDVAADLTADCLRFGTTANGLTAAQLKCFRNGSSKCYLDENGYLRAYPPQGIVIIVK